MSIRSLHPAWLVSAFGLVSISLMRIEPSLTPEQTRVKYELIETQALDDLKITLDGARRNRVIDTSSVGALFAGITRNAIPKDSPERLPIYRALSTQLNALNPEHLPACQRIDYYEISERLETRMRQITYHQSEPPTPERLRFERDVERMTGQFFTLEELRDLGAEELARVRTELADLQRRIGQPLDEFAAHPVLFSGDKDFVINTFKRRITEIETQMQHAFYDYDIPAGGVRLSDRVHPYRAIGQYDVRKSEMIAFWNTPKFDMKYVDMLTMHEVFPGHHLELQVNKFERLCPKRRQQSQAHTEGWATYIEYLAYEMGVFETDVQVLGWLDYRLIRAMRIVMDITLLESNLDRDAMRELYYSEMPKRLHPVFEREYERILRGGRQHFTYSIGQRAISNARAELEREMGDAFDLPRFHDIILRGRFARLGNMTERVRAAWDIDNPETAN